MIAARTLFVLLALFAVVPALAAPCPTSAAYQAFYDDARPFREAIAKVADVKPTNRRPTGIVVPHHMLAADLIALGFRSASAFAYKRIVILSPDHFHRARGLFATTTRGFDTVLGPVSTDGAAAAQLEASGLVEESCLFDREHGVRAMLPFVHHYFPGAEIVAVAMSSKAKRADWDRLAQALTPIVDPDTLVVESTDFSHFLPQHQARIFDQQTLTVLASGSLDAIAALQEPRPNHADSVGALYTQTALQRRLFGAAPLVIANANSQDYVAGEAQRTTSYVVALYGAFGPGFQPPALAGERLYYVAGDVNFGRAMKKVLLRDGAADRVVDSVLSITHGRPLIVNLEGVVLPEVPGALDGLTLAMPRQLAIDMLKRMKVAAVGLANNHAFDLGASGYAETIAALDAAGIPHFGQGGSLALADLDVAGLTDIDTNGSSFTDLVTPALLDKVVHPDAERPVVAFVHWGREYVSEPGSREADLAEALRLRGVTVIAGAHPHVSSGEILALGGGDTAEVYSLGNFLFDQSADRASGAILELRVFRQGTVFCRLIPLPNYFDMARK